MGPNPILHVGHKIHPTLEKGPIHAIPIGHKIYLTLEKGTHLCNTCRSQNTFYIKKGGPTHATLTYQIEHTLEKGIHICNTCISIETYSRKGSPSM